MILVDTSVWVDHFRSGDAVLAQLLQDGEVLTHPAVIGELVLGGLPGSGQILDDLLDLPTATHADSDEALLFIRRNALTGSGIGYADAQLLAAARLTAGAALWTRDRRLLAVAQRLNLAAEIEPYGGFHE